jgi:hypothetical protein
MREASSNKKTNEQIVRFFARYIAVRARGADLDDIVQELRIETWLAGKDWDPKKGDPSWSMFLRQRLQWKASKLIRSTLRGLTVERAFYRQNRSSSRWKGPSDDHWMVGDFEAPSLSLCCLSYELQQNLQSNEAKKVFQAMQVPVELISPDSKGSCPTVSQVASYLGIAELSVTRGLREIKRHLRVLLNGQRR